MRQYAVGFVVALLVIFVVVPVLGQGDSPVVVEAFSADSLDVSQALRDLLDNFEVWLVMVEDLVYLPFASSLVFLLTAIVKPIPYFSGIKVQHISLFFSLLIWLTYIVSQRAGLGLQFESILPLMATAGSAILGITLTPIVAGQIQERAKGKMALAFSRSTSPAGAVAVG